jgi:hypothetical protein
MRARSLSRRNDVPLRDAILEALVLSAIVLPLGINAIAVGILRPLPPTKRRRHLLLAWNLLAVTFLVLYFVVLRE